MAAAYSVRANAFAGVSAPLRWNEVDLNLRPEDFIISTMQERVKREGDLWAALRTTTPVNLHAPVG